MPIGGRSKVDFINATRKFINEDVIYEDDYLYENNNPTLKTEESIRKLLASSKTYEEKLEILEKEKKKATRMLNTINNQENNFLNTKHYLKEMISNAKKAKQRLKVIAPITLLTLTGTVFSGGSFINSRIADVAGSGNVGESILTGCIFVTTGIATAFLAGQTFTDARDVINYKDEIKEYRKMLQRKTK